MDEKTKPGFGPPTVEEEFDLSDLDEVVLCEWGGCSEPGEKTNTSFGEVYFCVEHQREYEAAGDEDDEDAPDEEEEEDDDD